MNLKKFNWIIIYSFIINFSLPINVFTTLEKQDFNKRSWFQVIPLSDILKNNPQIQYQKVCDTMYFDYPKFSIAPNFPNKGFFNELFILTIPNGRVQGLCGDVVIQGNLPEEMVRANRYDCLVTKQLNDSNFAKISGKVAVIAQHGAGQYWANYYHALYEVFGRLAILEMNNIEYDWLYVPTDKKFVREILQLWGIDFSKIISPTNEFFGVQADELIVPSLVINTSAGHKHAGNFQHPLTTRYVKKKLLHAALRKDIDISQFSKKIFISRKDSYNARRISNEDDIFALFESKGFKRYSLCDLSVTEQILLFNNADIIVCEQGSGLANIMFCKPQTTIIEIHQKLIDNCFWWVCNMLQLNYVPIKTVDADSNYFANWWDKGIRFLEECGKSIIAVPLDEIKTIADRL